MRQVVQRQVKAVPARFFQADKEEDRKIVQRGNDSPDRPVLNESQRNLVRVISDMIDEKETKCRDNCPVESIKDDIPHAIEAVIEVGKGSFRRGINDARNVVIDLISFIKNIKSMKWKIIGGLLLTLFLGALGIFYVGVIWKIKQGGM